MERPAVGVAVIIKKKNRYLLLKRKGKHGKGTWAPPGGHLELGESFHECAKRETLEEVGVQIGETRQIGVTNDRFDRETHYVTIWLIATCFEGEPAIREPDKIEDIQWVKKEEFLPSLFLPFQNFILEYEKEIQ